MLTFNEKQPLLQCKDRYLQVEYTKSGIGLRATIRSYTLFIHEVTKTYGTADSRGDFGSLVFASAVETMEEWGGVNRVHLSAVA